MHPEHLCFIFQNYNTEGSHVVTLVTCSVAITCQSRPRSWLFWLRFIVVLLILSCKLLPLYLRNRPLHFHRLYFLLFSNCRAGWSYISSDGL